MSMQYVIELNLYNRSKKLSKFFRGKSVLDRFFELSRKRKSETNATVKGYLFLCNGRCIIQWGVIYLPSKSNIKIKNINYRKKYNGKIYTCKVLKDRYYDIYHISKNNIRKISRSKRLYKFGG